MLVLFIRDQRKTEVGNRSQCDVTLDRLFKERHTSTRGAC